MVSNVSLITVLIVVETFADELELPPRIVAENSKVLPNELELSETASCKLFLMSACIVASESFVMWHCILSGPLFDECQYDACVHGL